MEPLSPWELILRGLIAAVILPFALVNLQTPQSTVRSLAQVAQKDKLHVLDRFCDPFQENDGDTDCLCGLSPKYEAHQCSESSHNRVEPSDFKRCFSTLEIAGEVRYPSENRAIVPLRFDPEACDGMASEEMHLVSRFDGEWFLSHF